MTRRGVTLLELLVALALLGAVFAGLPRSSAADRARRADREAARLATDAADLIVRDLRGGGAVMALGDTAVELTRVVGVAAACASTAPLVVVDDASRHWLEAPRAGDDLAIWRDTTWAPVSIDAVSAERCATGARGTRLATGAVPAGAPVVVLRRVRWVAYRDGEGRAQVGVRERRANRWSAVQPAVGPADSVTLATSIDAALARVEVRVALGARWHVAARVVALRNAVGWP